ncbi:class I SAM-dependent methyltransferase [Candidatus Pacearchaeota archaeon]|nr:class I SAM-dependent methyltransferase [Candidatus Pacearchaeota archaeon]
MPDIFSTRVLKDVTKGKRIIVDAGCGEGTQAVFLARQNLQSHVRGYDMSSEDIAIANRLKAKHRVGNVQFQVSSHDDYCLEEKADILFTVGSLLGPHEVIMKTHSPLDDNRDLVQRRLVRLASMLASGGQYVFYWSGTENVNKQFIRMAEQSGLKHQATHLDKRSNMTYVQGTGELKYRTAMVFGV